MGLKLHHVLARLRRANIKIWFLFCFCFQFQSKPILLYVVSHKPFSILTDVEKKSISSKNKANTLIKPNKILKCKFFRLNS